ncbi:hypothetical protein PRUPE_3G072100 [Prunus persica]|uniref:Uncharacterized protein n=1 Tax=Prunus persica TaxID=3760 RepID=A0A251PWQ3_PRUPE|nr:hypothetical protein PRUPE_3G072100 [Prunus persica]
MSTRIPVNDRNRILFTEFSNNDPKNQNDPPNFSIYSIMKSAERQYKCKTQSKWLFQLLNLGLFFFFFLGSIEYIEKRR